METSDSACYVYSFPYNDIPETPSLFSVVGDRVLHEKHKNFFFRNFNACPLNYYKYTHTILKQLIQYFFLF